MLEDEPEAEVEYDEAGQAVATLSPITIKTRSAPELVLYRRGVAGKWTIPAALATGEYRAEVYSAYSVMVVCDNTIKVESRLLVEGATIEVPCGPTPFVPPPTVLVNFRMVQPGTVDTFHPYGRFSNNWIGSANIPAAVRDVFAYDSTRFAMRPNVDLTASTTLPTFDLDREGGPLPKVTFTAPPLQASERATLRSVFYGINNGTALPVNGMTTSIVPTALHAGGRSHEVTYSVFEYGPAAPWGHQYYRDRLVTTKYRLGDPATFTLWDAVTAPQFGAEVLSPYATWATRDLASGLLLELNQAGRSARHKASRRYLQAARLTRLTIDFAAPGIPTARLFDPLLTGTFVSLTGERDTPTAPATYKYQTRMTN